jgi:alkylhydroperoxidase family enzyme
MQMAEPQGTYATIAIAMPSDDAIRKVTGPAHDPHAMLNVIKMMAGTEDMYLACTGFIGALFQTQGIDPRTREMIMLRAAKIFNCPYEWEANKVLARNVGLTGEDIAAAASESPATGLSPEYQLICRATDELSLTATLSDETLSQLLAFYGDVVSRKLILIIGWFNLLSRFLNGCRVPLEDFGKLVSKNDPLN